MAEGSLQKKDNLSWEEFLGRRVIGVPPARVEGMMRGRRVLITGAGGSIGSAVSRLFAAGSPETLVMLDLSEAALYESHRKIPSLPQSRIIPVVGSVCDTVLLDRVLGEYVPDLIVHAAAYKHVPLMEQNPFSAISNNVVGTFRLVQATRKHGIHKMLMVSTDKSVDPCSMMGVSKRLAELVVLAHSSASPALQVLRLGNVLGSSGSVSLLFQEQLRAKQPLTVTNVNAERYFLTIEEVESALLEAIRCEEKQGIWIADCGSPRRVLDLALFLAHQETRSKEPEIQFIGLRPGDKLREKLVADDESVEIGEMGRLSFVHSPHPAAADVTAAINALESAIESSDLCALIATITQLVPQYKPGSQISSLLVECK